jgi:hypothetical protein
MYPIYEDLRERLGTPLWVDEFGVPRYCEFTPDAAANIYAEWVALMEVECQACQKTFKCATSLSLGDFARMKRIDEYIANQTNHNWMIEQLIRWGDAPWHTYEGDEASFDGQCAGTTMSTEVRRAKVWRKVRGEWVPVPIPETVCASLGLVPWLTAEISGGGSFNLSLIHI